jgi:hypothetical protein
VDKLLLQGDDGVFRVAPDAAGAADAGIGNETPRQGHWLAVRAIDPALRRDAIGARIEVQLTRR